ncbi:MAG TPA: hypothetical protein VLZ11_04590 [Flavobacterium sp.]|nr:hypothetical protein [Flavobacterium sp.]
MDTLMIFQILAYCLPALITGGVAYYFFNLHIQNEDNRRNFMIRKENQKQALPLRIQAYERMALYLERIEPSKLLIRIAPDSSDKNEYEQLIIAHIEQEFEHNLTQQIYMSDKCWMVINTAKSTLVQTIRKANMSEKIDSANKLREVILMDLLDKPSPTSVALAFLKNEVSELLSV